MKTIRDFDFPYEKRILQYKTIYAIQLRENTVFMRFKCLYTSETKAGMHKNRILYFLLFLRRKFLIGMHKSRSSKFVRRIFYEENSTRTYQI